MCEKERKFDIPVPNQTCPHSRNRKKTTSTSLTNNCRMSHHDNDPPLMPQSQQPCRLLIMRTRQKMEPFPKIEKHILGSIVARNVELIHDVVFLGPVQFLEGIGTSVTFSHETVALSEYVVNGIGRGMRHFEQEGYVHFRDAVVGASEHINEDAGTDNGLAVVLGSEEVVVCSLKLARIMYW